MAGRAVLVCSMLMLLAIVVQGEVYTFSAALTGNQVVPPVASTANGIATFTYDDTSGKLFYSIKLQAANGVIGIRLHGPALPGATAPSIEDLRRPEAGASSGSVSISSKQFEFLVDGKLYVQVDTSANQNGEIRGQLVTTATEFISSLRGRSMVPPVSTSASGFASVKYDANTRVITYYLKHDVQRPRVAHIHGPADETDNGPVILTLDSPNSPIEGSAILTDEQINFLKTGLLYFKVHSDQFPDGEIRGQILIDPSSSGYDGFTTTLVTGLVLSSVALVALVVLGGFAVWQQRRANIARPAVDA